MRTKLIFGMLITYVLIGCSPRVIRSGYNSKMENQYSNCNVVIRKRADFNEKDVEVIGMVKIRDTGFSIKCSEADALDILKVEACNTGADIIHILSEKRPDVWSTCYRVDAELLKITNSDTSETTQDSDKQYKGYRVQTRVADDQKRNNSTMMLSVVAGLVSFLVTFMIFSGGGQ